MCIHVHVTITLINLTQSRPPCFVNLTHFRHLVLLTELSRVSRDAD